VERPEPKVLLASVGDPRSPATWSGVTAGVFAGLRDMAFTTQTLDLSLPGVLEQALLAAGAAPTLNRFDAEAAPMTVGARTMRARLRLRGGVPDGAIQIGTTFELPAGVPYVTLEDMTVRQGAAIHPVFSRMSQRTLEGWERRRAGIYSRARMCGAASHWTADSLRADYGVPDERIAVVGFGANHLAAPVQRDWRCPRFLFVGIDWERKGGPLLLRVFGRLREAHPQALLDVVGGHPALSQEGVTAHGVLSRTRPSEREQLERLFERATCLVMPSQVEPFGIAYVEAGSAGVPSIGSSAGGPRDVIGHDGGLVVDPGDEQQLLDAMNRLADPATAQRMGAAAQERSGLYTWTRVAERLLRALGLVAPDGRELAGFL
jgi:hypothetical protein